MSILPPNRLKQSPNRLFWLLVFSAVVGQTALHIVVPALGAISEAFSVSFGTAQLIVSVSMVAMAVATLIVGPLSDIYGRRPVMLIGLILFTSGGLIAMFAASIEMIVAGRALQGMGGVAGLAIGRAILRDLYDLKDAAKGMSYLLIGQVMGPALAPIIGALILLSSDWRLIFAFLVVFGILILVASFLWLEETRIPEKIKGKGAFQRQAKRLFVNKSFWASCMICAMTITMFFTLISSASWAVSEKFNLNEMFYALVMITFNAHFVLANFLSSRLIDKQGPLALIKLGSFGNMLAVALFCLVFWAEPPLPFYLVPCACFALSNGFMVANAQAIALDVDPRAAGTASGLVIFVQLLCASLFSQVVGMYLPSLGFLAVGAALILCSLVLTGSMVVLLRVRRDF